MTTNLSTNEKGLAAQTANPNVKPNKLNFNDNSAFNQRLKLLDYLFEHGSITTTEARKKLDIMSPATRIFEMKAVGYLINTVPAEWVSEHGVNHKGVARYVLVQKEPVERDNESKVAA